MKKIKVIEHEGESILLEVCGTIQQKGGRFILTNGPIVVSASSLEYLIQLTCGRGDVEHLKTVIEKHA